MWSCVEPVSSVDESIVGVFCTNGLLRISSKQTVTKTPNINGILQNIRLIISIDSTLILYPDEKRYSAVNYIDVGHPLEVIAVSASGNIILCGLSNGNICVLHISGVGIFTFEIQPADVGTDGPCFVGIFDEGNGNFLLQTSRGSVYRVTMNEEKIIALIASGNEQQVQEQMPQYGLCERVIGKQFKDRIGCFIPVKKESNVPLIAAASMDTIFFFREDKVEKIELKPEYKGVKKMFSLMNCKFALTYSGQLFEICPLTKLMSELPCSFGIDDLVTLEATADIIEMLILTKPDANGKVVMKIVNFPSMEIKQEMEMSEHTWLVQQPKNSANIYYIAGQTFKEPVVQELELKILSETDPSLRLAKLIKIGRLDEAEVFAKQFELDIHLVHQARAKLLLDELCSSTNMDDTFRKLLKVLADVTDLEFLTGIRNANICDRNMKKRYLQFLLSKVSTPQNVEMDSVIDINEQLLRMETLKLIDPFEIDQDWQQFVCHDNLLQLCTELFQKDMDAACLIWSRHIACILPQLDDAKVAILLRSIPKETSPLHVIQWLLHFVGPILHHQPQLMNLLVQFIVTRTKSFQKLPGWPMVGLTFIEDVNKMLQEVQFPIMDLRLQFDSNMEELKRMANALRDLVTLKQQFNLQARLDCYMQEDIKSTAFSLLQITPLNLLDRIVMEFLCKFFVGKESLLCQQIVRYITFLIGNQHNSFWDQRCVTLVELLFDEQQQLETILTILRAAPVPWSPAIASLMRYANSDHPIAASIVAEQHTQTIKCLKIKYGWSLKAQGNTRLLVQRVLKLHHPEMLADIRAIVKTAPELGFTTDVSVMVKMAEYGDIIIAAEYLDELEKKRREDCCRSTISLMTRMIDDGRISHKRTMAYLEALQMLKHRADTNQKKEIHQIVNIVQLRSEFGLNATCKSICDPIERRNLLLAGVKFILGKIQNKRSEFLNLLLGAVRRLSTFLSCSLPDALYEVMLMLKNINLSCLVAAQLPEMVNLRQPGAFESVHRIVSLLLAQHMQSDTACGWIEDPLTFPVCRELLYQSATDCPRQSSKRLELLRWVQVGVQYYPVGIENECIKRNTVPDAVLNVLYEQFADGGDERMEQDTGITNGVNGKHTAKADKRDSLSAFDVINDDFDQINVPRNKHIPEQQTIVQCVGLALQMILCRIKNEDRSSTFAHLLALTGPLHEVSTSTAFQSTLDRLIRAKQYPPVVNILHLLRYYQSTVGLMIPAPYAENVYRKAIKYMLSQKEPNYSSAIMTLFTCENREACLEYLRTNLTNESQLVSLHTLLEFYYFTIGQEAKAVDERNLRLRHTLFHELCKLDPSLKSKKSFIFHSQADLIKELKHKVINVELLRKMSDAFSWDYQQMLVSQVITYLSQQDISFTVRSDTFGREEIIVHDTPEAILAQVQPFLAEIDNSVLLCSKLNLYMEHANGYFYEQFFCIFDILAQFSEETNEMRAWSGMLTFMKEQLTGRRRQRPGQAEVEAWMRVHADGDMLPEIAKYRYPFMLILRQPLKSLLKEDITIENYRKLLILVSMKASVENLDCDEMNDYFCKSAVMNSINEYKIQSRETFQHSEWHRQSKNKAFLQSILRIVDSVRDISTKLYILYYITCNALDGDDQESAAYACYRFARQHEANLVGIAEAKDKVEKIYRKYPVLKTQQLLQQNGVTDDKLFQLVKTPQELIKALYTDSCFQKVNVNELAATIGQLHDLDVEAIQMGLLQKWLTIFGGPIIAGDGYGSGTMLDETLYDDHNMSDTSQEGDTNVHESMARAYYILSSWKRAKSVEFLVAQLNSIVDASHGAPDVGKQLQIYQCFSKLADDNCTSYKEFFTQQRFIALKCVYLLRSLGMHTFSIAKFEATDKMELLKMLWQSHATNPKGLEVLSLICIGYNIYIPQIWNGILKQMARLGLVGNLRALIDIVTAKRQLFGLEGYRMAWEILIKEPFRSANREQSLAEDAVLARSLVMVQKCPISFRLNLLEIAEACFNVNRVNMAAVLMGFADDEQREKLKKQIADNTVPNLSDQIRELEEFGLATTIAKAVCREILPTDSSPLACKKWRKS